MPAALDEAKRFEMDLIEIAPEADPPVCRIIDYNKFRYEQQKKIKESTKKSRHTEVKGIRVRPNTDDHDLGFKARNALRFLTKGNMVKFTVIFRGPELRHKEIGMQQLQTFIAACAEVAEIEIPPKMEGRQMTMVLRPKASTAKAAAAARAPHEKESAPAPGAPAPEAAPVPEAVPAPEPPPS